MYKVAIIHNHNLYPILMDYSYGYNLIHKNNAHKTKKLPRSSWKLSFQLMHTYKTKYFGFHGNYIQFPTYIS